MAEVMLEICVSQCVSACQRRGKKFSVRPALI